MANYNIYIRVPLEPGLEKAMQQDKKNRSTVVNEALHKYLEEGGYL